MLAIGTLGRFGGVNAGHPYRRRLAGLADAEGVAVSDAENGGGNT
jgi:hypothetical protein